MGSPIERYAALSYVWGGNLTLMLLNSNYAELSDAGFSSYIERIPRTIIGAFSVVRDLGIRYIWVDSLCIIQDSRGDWDREARQMDAVYRNAILTVCAASAHSASDGIAGIEDMLRTEEENCFPLSSFRVRTVAPVAEMIHASPWDTRAWTFQERLLSRRCAIFTPNEIVWQCRAATWRESVEYPLDASMWTLDVIGTPFRDMNENPVRRYVSCVTTYSGRKLTYLSDKSAAFRGLESVLARELDSGERLLFGLPSRYFDWAMLWEPREPGPQISSVGASPSWSWCGWDHEVEWRQSMLGGPLFDLHTWFKTRTWVTWFYADGQGSDMGWSLVWNVSQEQPRRLSGPDRWEGYLPIDGENGDLMYGRTWGVIRKIFDGVFGAREVVEAELDVTEESKISLEWLRSPPARLAPCTDGLLGFRTFTGMFSLSRKSMSSSTFSTLSRGLRRFGIVDRAGDWCGTIVLDELKWLSQVGALFEFAAISCAKDFAMDELDTWTYYIPQEREHADWYCFFAIMLKPMPGSPGIFERAGLAKIYGSAFALGSFPNARWKEIVLC
ncbi:hypothetical protein DL767_010655 [Monosporascus sp. MG133]|nr:hypothetical protein DL767_010655 [Monosporascus sp. MG133]